MLQHGWALRTLWQMSNKPIIKGEMLYDSAYITHLEESNSQRQNRTVVVKGSGEEGMGSYFLMVQSYSLGRCKNSGDG